MNTCSTCKFWVGNEDMGDCHYWNPWFALNSVASLTPHDPSHWRHPTTTPDDWCSNFQGKDG